MEGKNPRYPEPCKPTIWEISTAGVSWDAGCFPSRRGPTARPGAREQGTPEAALRCQATRHNLIIRSTDLLNSISSAAHLGPCASEHRTSQRKPWHLSQSTVTTANAFTQVQSEEGEGRAYERFPRKNDLKQSSDLSKADTAFLQG